VTGYTTLYGKCPFCGISLSRTWGGMAGVMYYQECFHGHYFTWYVDEPHIRIGQEEE